MTLKVYNIEWPLRNYDIIPAVSVLVLAAVLSWVLMATGFSPISSTSTTEMETMP